MPVCAMSDVARHVQTAGTFRELGITGTVPEVNFPALLREMQKVQETIASVLDKETRDAGVDIIYGKEGRFDGNQVIIGDEKLEADAVILSTGSRPNIPAIPGMTSPGIYTPHTLRTMERLPEKLVIIGGGIVAAEFAYIFSRFGSRVTILSRGRFLKNLDEHLRKRAIRELSGSRSPGRDGRAFSRDEEREPSPPAESGRRIGYPGLRCGPHRRRSHPQLGVPQWSPQTAKRRSDRGRLHADQRPVRLCLRGRDRAAVPDPGRPTAGDRGGGQYPRETPEDALRADPPVAQPRVRPRLLL